jgi:hypothetical protein
MRQQPFEGCAPRGHPFDGHAVAEEHAPMPKDFLFTSESVNEGRPYFGREHPEPTRERADLAAALKTEAGA